MAADPSPALLARRAIPESAQGAGNPPVWTMEHPRPDLLKLKFNRSAQNKLQRLPLDLMYLALAAGYVFVVWRLMTYFDVFDSVLLHIAAALLPVILYIRSIGDNNDLLVETLTIDRQAGHINGTGLTGSISSESQCTLKGERFEIHYTPGWIGACIVVAAGSMRFKMDRLAPVEDNLHAWLEAMLAEDVFVDPRTKLPVAADRGIPAKAHCLFGERYWTMTHPSSGRLEVRFPVRTPHPVERPLIVAFWLALLATCAYGAYLLSTRGDLSWQFMLIVGLAMVLAMVVSPLHPRLGMRVQELVIDRTAGTISTTGVVHWKRATVVHQLAHVGKVNYTPGYENIQRSSQPARILIDFPKTGKAIKLDHLALHDTQLEVWIRQMTA